MRAFLVSIVGLVASGGSAFAEAWQDPSLEVTEAIIMLTASSACSFDGLENAEAIAIDRANTAVGVEAAAKRMARGYIILLERTWNDNGRLCSTASEIAGRYARGE